MHPTLYPQAPSLLTSDGFRRVAALLSGCAGVGARGPAHDPAPSGEEGVGQIGRGRGGGRRQCHTRRRRTQRSVFLIEGGRRGWRKGRVLRAGVSGTSRVSACVGPRYRRWSERRMLRAEA
jgi:hypothetical protein